MHMSQITPTTFRFLNKLASNNNREWFQKHKEEYDVAHANMISFADAVLFEMNKHDKIETESGKKSLYRIYRDIRFSKDKTPYKINFSAGFKRATKQLRGGYYMHIQPGHSFVGGGFWGPNTDDLKQIRTQIANDPELLRDVIESKEFKKNFGAILGEQLKTSPKGYEKDHPAVDLLRYKSFIVKQDFSDEQVLADDFYLQVNSVFKNMRPFFDCMTEMLITDLNGELLPGY